MPRPHPALQGYALSSCFWDNSTDIWELFSVDNASHIIVPPERTFPVQGMFRIFTLGLRRFTQKLQDGIRTGVVYDESSDLYGNIARNNMHTPRL